MHGTDVRRIAERQALGVRIERLAELVQIGERAAQLQIGVLAVQQQTEDGLRGARIVDHLLGEEDAVQPAVLHNRTGRLVVLHPLEQEDQAVDGPARWDVMDVTVSTFEIHQRVRPHRLLNVPELLLVEAPQLLHLDAGAACAQTNRLNRT